MVRGLFAAISLAASPIAVSAQSAAWVLWEENVFYRSMDTGVGSGQTTWTVKSAYERRTVCDEFAAKGASDAALEALEKNVFDPGKVASFKRYDPSSLILVIYKDGARRTLSWNCLPDTVDPRPK